MGARVSRQSLPEARLDQCRIVGVFGGFARDVTSMGIVTRLRPEGGL